MKKTKGRYINASSKKIKNRQYTSYEDAPLKSINEVEPVPQNLTLKFLKVFLILFFSVVVVLALINIDKLTPDNISHWFQYELLGKTEGNGTQESYRHIVFEKGQHLLFPEAYGLERSLIKHAKGYAQAVARTQRASVKTVMQFVRSA